MASLRNLKLVGDFFYFLYLVVCWKTVCLVSSVRKNDGDLDFSLTTGLGELTTFTAEALRSATVYQSISKISIVESTSLSPFLQFVTQHNYFEDRF